jgi:hypothetical protein
VHHFIHLTGATALSLLFSYLAIKAGQESKLLEEASRGLFGDPLSRSLLAVVYYIRNLAAPFYPAISTPTVELGTQPAQKIALAATNRAVQRGIGEGPRVLSHKAMPLRLI